MAERNPWWRLRRVVDPDREPDPYTPHPILSPYARRWLLFCLIWVVAIAVIARACYA